MPLGIPAPGDYGDFRMLTSQETIDLFGYPFDVVQWKNGDYYQIGPNTNLGQSVNITRVLTPQSGNNNSFTIPNVARSPFDVSPSDGDMFFEVSGFLGGGAVPSGALMPPGNTQPSLATTAGGGGVIEGSVIPAGGGVPWGLMFVVAVIVWAILAED